MSRESLAGSQEWPLCNSVSLLLCIEKFHAKNAKEQRRKEYRNADFADGADERRFFLLRRKMDVGK